MQVFCGVGFPSIPLNTPELAHELAHGIVWASGPTMTDLGHGRKRLAARSLIHDGCQRVQALLGGLEPPTSGSTKLRSDSMSLIFLGAMGVI